MVRVRVRVQQLKWEAPDTEGLVDFLVREKGFSCVPPLSRARAGGRAASRILTPPGAQ